MYFCRMTLRLKPSTYSKPTIINNGVTSIQKHEFDEEGAKVAPPTV